MANEIKIKRNNSSTVIEVVSGLDTLSGYTSVLTARPAVASTGTTFSITGSTSGLPITYMILPVHTNIEPATLNYDSTHSNGVNNYTSIQSLIIIEDSVRW